MQKGKKRNPGSLPVQLASVACTFRHVIHLGSLFGNGKPWCCCWYEQSNASTPTHKRGPRNNNQSALTVEIFKTCFDRRASPDWRSWNRQARQRAWMREMQTLAWASQQQHSESSFFFGLSCSMDPDMIRIPTVTWRFDSRRTTVAVRSRFSNVHD